MAEIKKISTELQLLDKFLDTSGDAGTSGQVLTSTGTGINWVSGGSLPGGPYLPLTAGSSYPLTGDLYIDGNSSQKFHSLIFHRNGSSTNFATIGFSNPAANNSPFLITSSGNGNEMIIEVGAGDDIEFRSNDNSGTTSTFASIGNSSYFTGDVGIGTTGPVSSLNITTTKTVALDTAAKFLTLGLTVDDLTAGNTAGGGGGIAFRSKNTNAGTQIVFGAIDAIKESANVSDFRGSLRFFTNQNSTGIPLERMRIDSAGNVGIGRTSPSTKLQVAGIIQINESGETAFYEGHGVRVFGTQNYRFRNTGGGVRAVIDVNSTGVTAGNLSLYNASNVVTSYINNAGNSYFNGGNVGIGTTSPNDGKLQVFGNSNSDWAGYFYNQNANGIGLHVETNSYGTEQLLRLSSLTGSGGSNTVRMVVRADGNVGIGTTTPTAKLDVRLSTATGKVAELHNNAGYGIGFTVESDGGVNTINSESNQALAFATNGASNERMRITTGGNVGIGTTSPGYKLTVEGAVAVQDAQNLWIRGGRVGYENTALDNAAYIYNIGAAGSSKLNIADTLYVVEAGNVGIGTITPGYKLEVAGTARITSALTFGGNVNNIIAGTGSSLDFKSNGEYYFRKGTNTNLTILSNGNVGIGTTTPISLSANTTSLTINSTRNDLTGALFFRANNSTKAQFYCDSSGLVSDTISGAARWHTGSTERMRISSAGAIKFNAYGAGTLVTDASGNITASSGGGAGGPFLPLAGGTMTGTSGVIMPNDFNLKAGNSGNSAPAYTFREDTNTGMFQDIDDALSFSAGGATVLHMDGADAFIPRYITHLGDPNTYFGFSGNDTIRFNTNGSEAMVIDSSGDVGIGNTSPGNKLEVTGIIEATVGDTGGFAYGANPASKQGLMISVSNTGGDAFSGAGRIENTSTTNSSSAVLVLRQTNSASFSTITQYRQGSGTQGNLVGFVRVTTTNTIFSTSGSDERLKKNITNWTDDTLGKFKALQPKKFRYKIQDASEEKTSGFIAQNEVANFPEAYILNKENEEDDAMYSFNPMGMTTHLMKAIKDLVEKVEILENKITQLENNN